MLRGPPKDFDRTDLALIEVEPSALLRLAYRVRTSHLGFRTTAKYRFDAPASEFGVLYAAFDLPTAFVETVLRTVPQEIAAGELPLLTYEELSRRRVVHLASGGGCHPLRMVKLLDEGLSAAKIDNRLATIDDYATTRLWAKAFWNHPLKVDGVVYLSRFMGARPSVVLFDRCASKVRRARVVPLLRHPEFPNLVDQFQLSITQPRRSRR